MGGDLVTFIISIPDHVAGESSIIKSVGEKPTLSGYLEVGRTLDDIFKNLNERMPMIFEGAKGHADASFAAALAKAVGRVLAMYGYSKSGQATMFEAISEVDYNGKILYRDPDNLNDEVKTWFPKFEMIPQILNNTAYGMTPDVQEAIKMLDGTSAGTKRIALRGLPHDYQLALELEHFNLAPVLHDLVKKKNKGS